MVRKGSSGVGPGGVGPVQSDREPGCLPSGEAAGAQPTSHAHLAPFRFCVQPEELPSFQGLLSAPGHTGVGQLVPHKLHQEEEHGRQARLGIPLARR